MEDCNSEVPMLNAEENLIAAAQQIAAALGAKRNWTENEIKSLIKLRAQLSTVTMLDESKDEAISHDNESKLNAVHEKIMKWDGDESMVWDSGPEEAAEYLKAVDEALKLIHTIESSCLSDDGEVSHDLLRRAYDILQTAMARLEEEFRHMLIHNQPRIEPDCMSFRSSEGDNLDECSTTLDGSPSDESVHRESGVTRGSEEFIIDLVHPEIIRELKCIADLMFASKYDRECSQAYISVRKDALSECLCILEVEKASIEDVIKMEWDNLNSKIKTWVWAMKIFVRRYLASEKKLSDDIFGSFGSMCFVESSKASVIRMLDFGDAVSVGPRQPEKLACILDMYEVLAYLAPEFNALYSDDVGESVRSEFCEVLRRLGNAARATFFEFKEAIMSNASTNPFAGGGIHHLTRYVMNYIKLLGDYRATLGQILEYSEAVPLSPDASPSIDENIRTNNTSGYNSLTGSHFQSIASALEKNLDNKSKLYKDTSLQYFFLMNNIHYMAEKVKHSELRDIFGDGWIKRHNAKFQQHAMNYERATWTSILSLLKDDGAQSTCSSSSSLKSVLKERLRNFYAAFEEVYKSQTGWLIPDSRLREDLRESTSLKVIQAYRTFVGRHVNDISDRHIKYSADDLQNYILNLFDGSPKSLH